jgi:dihydroorotate dehydrogenase (fumarate)
MADLKTKYLGLELKNPVIVAASGITGDLEGIAKCERYGAGAVVLKSMFEEIIVSQSNELDSEMLRSEHPEAYGYVEAGLGIQMGPKPYLKFVQDAKKRVSIPVIASVNCTSAKRWISYAEDIESAGADALELNISHFPERDSYGDVEIIKSYFGIVSEVTAKLKIPVAVKLGYNFTSVWNVADEVIKAGASGLVLFNRYYAVDVDLDEKKFTPSMTFSSSQEMSMPLRWIGLLSGTVNCSLAANSGIHSPESALKMIMAGADAVQICSILYLRGINCLEDIVRDMGVWLDVKGYSTLSEIRGLASKNSSDKDSLLKRLQYVKALHEAAKYEF